MTPLDPPPTLDTFQQERSEVLESVFEALARQPPDPDETAACLTLMRHLRQEFIRSTNC
jgi:hypothetical protein